MHMLVKQKTERKQSMKENSHLENSREEKRLQRNLTSKTLRKDMVKTKV